MVQTKVRELNVTNSSISWIMFSFLSLCGFKYLWFHHRWKTATDFKLIINVQFWTVVHVWCVCVFEKSHYLKTHLVILKVKLQCETLISSRGNKVSSCQPQIQFFASYTEDCGFLALFIIYFFFSNWHKCLSFIAKVPFCKQYILDFIRMDLWLFYIRKFTEEGIKPGKSVTFQKNLTCLCTSFMCFLYWLNHKAMCFCLQNTLLWDFWHFRSMTVTSRIEEKHCYLSYTWQSTLNRYFPHYSKERELGTGKKDWRLRIINIEDRNRENSSTASWTQFFGIHILNSHILCSLYPSLPVSREL